MLDSYRKSMSEFTSKRRFKCQRYCFEKTKNKKKPQNLIFFFSFQMKNQKHLNIITSANKSKTCNFYFMCNIQMIDHFDFFLFWFRFFLFLINLNCGLCAGSFLFLWRRWTRFRSLYNNFVVIIIVVVVVVVVVEFTFFVVFFFFGFGFSSSTLFSNDK